VRRRTQTILGGTIFCLGIALASRGAGSATEVSELKVTIREWAVPTKGVHPHDPAVGVNGALWFTEQMVSKIGRLDLKSGAFKEYALKIEDSGRADLLPIAKEISGSREISRVTSASSTRGRDP
jgi:streptogramin lyase